ncbi:hypothetical protein Ahia01_000645300 [Argonauta hians]
MEYLLDDQALNDINKVIKEARNKEILDEREYEDLDGDNRYFKDSLEKSQRLIRLVKNDRKKLDVLIDILKSNGNKTVAIMMKLTREFVFHIVNKKNCDGKPQFILPRKIRTQFIYETNLEKVLEKVTKTFHSRIIDRDETEKIIPEQVYIVLAQNQNQHNELLVNASDIEEVSKFTSKIRPIFRGIEKIIILFVGIGRYDIPKEEVLRPKIEKELTAQNEDKLPKITLFFTFMVKPWEDLINCDNVMTKLKNHGYLYDF